MKILQLCNRIPFPPKDGGSIAIYNLSKGLHELGHELFMLAMNTKKHFIHPNEIQQHCLSFIKLQTVYADTSVRMKDAFFNLFSDKSYNITRFIISNYENALIKLLEQNTFDVIQLESLFLAPYLAVIRKYSGAKVILRAHNVEFKIWERMTQTTPPGLKKIYLHLLTKRLKKYETEQLNKFDAVVPITAEDKVIFRFSGCSKKIHVTPLGVDIKEYNTEKGPEHFSIFHLGSMDWMPNEEAIWWFLKEVWKKLSVQFPELKFYIAGRGMPAQLKKIKIRGVIIIDNVEDVKQFMNSKSVMVVPLLSGSGMRVKIIEGMALGKTIVSTTTGAEGIQCSHLKDILIANTADEFMKMLGRCMKDKLFCEEIGKNARLLVEQHYNNKNIAAELAGFYETV